MQITIENLGKKFNKDWIFRNLHTSLFTNQAYAVTGANGSGKSTLLQIIAGMLPATEGTISYRVEKQLIEADQIFRHIVMAAPYLELIEEFTLTELVQFHVQFKKFRNNLPIPDFINKIGLYKSRNKLIKYFSSGMKQRVKLGLAFYSDAALLFLDEPTSNLDNAGIAWYQQEVTANKAERLLIICSNQLHEYEFCKNILHIQDSSIKMI
jgi:ABC-type multidrug transport system ATPase subunit